MTQREIILKNIEETAQMMQQGAYKIRMYKQFARNILTCIEDLRQLDSEGK